MTWLGTAWGFTKAAFGLAKDSSGAEAAEKIGGQLLSMADDLKFTAQEKAEQVKAVMPMIVELHKADADANSIRSQTRRYLARAFCQVFLFLVVFMAFFRVLSAVYNENGSGKWIDLSAAFFQYASLLSTIILTIICFYFGYYGFTAIAAKFKKG